MAVFRVQNYRAPRRDKNGKELPGEDIPENRLVSTCETTRDAQGNCICEHWELGPDGKMAYTEHVPSKGESAALESREREETLNKKRKQLDALIATMLNPGRTALLLMKELYEER